MPVVLQHTPRRSSPISYREDRSSWDEIIVVVPTKRRIRHLSREVIGHVPGGVSPALSFHTLESLARSIYVAFDGARRGVSGPVQTLLFHMAIRGERGSLEYFKMKGREPQLFRGTFEKIIDVINALKEGGVYPEILEQEAAEAPLDERQKLKDITAIYRGYDARLDAIAAIDSAGLFKFLSIGCSQAQFANAFSAVYPSVRVLSLAGFDEFTLPEIGFVRKICALPEVSVSLLFDFQPGNTGLFGHLEENYRRFMELGFVPLDRPKESTAASVALNIPRRSGRAESAAGYLAQNLFNAEWQGARRDFSGEVTLLRAHSRIHEVELICKLIKQLAAEKPESDLSAICVAMFRPQIYTDILREQFDRFGIPANITDRFSLCRSQFVVTLFGLLQIPLNGFRRDDLLRVIRSPFLSFADGGSPLDAGNLAEVSRRLRITAGYQSWLRRIDRALARAADRRLASAGRSEQVKIDSEIGSLKKGRTDIQRVYRLTQDITVNVTAREFPSRLGQLLERLDVPRRLIARGVPVSHDLLEREVRAYARFLQVVEETVELLEFQDGPSTTHPLGYYVEHLRMAVLRERYNVREQFGRGVLVTSIDETRGLSLDVMILAGLVDGEFPSVYQPEVFFSTKRQTQREQRYLWQNRYLFYQAATNWSDHLYLTYPEKEGELELVRSSFVDALLKIAEVDLRTDRRDIPFDDRLCSEEELLRWRVTHVAMEQGSPASIPEVAVVKLGRVQRAIEVERSRVSTHLFPDHEGMIFAALSASARSALAQMRLRTYSVSQLETYARCPFRFFAERILHLNVVRDLEEGLTPLERGNLLHEALFEFHTRRRDGGLPSLSRCSDAEFEAAIEEFTRIIEEKLARFDIDDPFWEVDRQTILGWRGGRRGLVREYLEFERQRKLEVEPRFFEVAFGDEVGVGGGTDLLLSRSEPVMIGEISVRGKVDRVDVGKEVFTIVDYKSGSSIVGIEEIRSGLSLQIPLYLTAVRELTGNLLMPAAGLYAQLRTPVRMQIGMARSDYAGIAFEPAPRSRHVLKGADELDAVLESAVVAANNYVARIAAGEFPLTASGNVEKVCSYCEYKAMCRIQVLRHVSPKQLEDA